MAIFLDSARADDIRRAQQYCFIAGITTNPEIMAANLTSVDEITEVLYAGAHHVTLPLKMIDAMFNHGYSCRAITRFEEAVKALATKHA